MRTRSAQQNWSARWIASCNPGPAILRRARCCGAWRPAERIFITTSKSDMIETKPSPAKLQPNPSVEETVSQIDTSKMSAGQRAALELTEAAREAEQKPSFVGGLFMGSFDLP